MQLDPRSPSFSESQGHASESQVGPEDLKHALASPSISVSTEGSQHTAGEAQGYRAAEAYIRPSPIVTNGHVTNFVFDLRNCTFTMSLNASSSTPVDGPTEIYLPDFHFPSSNTAVSVSGGRWVIEYAQVESAEFQRLRWWHAEGEQGIKIQGVKRKPGTYGVGGAEDISYLEQCQTGSCSVM